MGTKGPAFVIGDPAGAAPPFSEEEFRELIVSMFVGHGDPHTWEGYDLLPEYFATHLSKAYKIWCGMYGTVQ
jgi:hypothetical protein